MTPLRAVLLDLDDTLFDHRGATTRSLTRLRAEFEALGTWTIDDLAERYGRILERVHLDVLAGLVTPERARELRFAELFTAVGMADAERAAVAAAARYRAIYDTEWRAVAGARGLLDALAAADLRIGIVTNNLADEQERKLRHLGLRAHVEVLVTTDRAGGSTKPAPAMFEMALEALGVGPDEAVMVGDGWATDVLGARAAGVRAVWFNPGRLPCPDPTVAQIGSFEPVEPAVACILGAVPAASLRERYASACGSPRLRARGAAPRAARE